MAEGKLHPRYPHMAGVTRLAYTHDGRHLFTVGAASFVRQFTVGSTDEPVTLETHDADVLAVAVSGRHFATCSNDGTANYFELATRSPLGSFFRSSLPLRDLAFSPDGDRVAIVGDDPASPALVSVDDILDRTELPGHPAAVKHVSYHPSGGMVATAACDGVVRFYSLSSTPPAVAHALDGVVPTVGDAADDKFTGIDWHPAGARFAVPTKTFEIAVYSRDSWLEETRIAHPAGHDNAITAIRWSPNGRYIASTGLDNKLVIWDVAAREPVASHRIDGASAIAWHPSANTVSVTTKHGALFTVRAAVPQDLPLPFGKQSAGSHDSNGTPVVNGNGVVTNGTTSHANGTSTPLKRKADDDIFGGVDNDDDDDGWLEDDDGAGYAEPEISQTVAPEAKKPRAGPAVDIQEPFVTGATPWQNGKRYMCVNALGYIWAVDQDDHNSVTVSFFNRGFHREYHFGDPEQYDLAALADDACLFANSKTGRILLRFHDGVGDNWEYTLKNDAPAAIALSSSIAVVCTKKGYVRVFNLFGTPLRVYREARDSIVTCATHGSLLMSVRARGDGSLTYSIEDTATEQVFQRGGAMDVAPTDELAALFFSDDGDPYMYDTSGVLAALVHWRDPLQARWTPVLDTAELDDPDRSLWPAGVLDRKLQAVVLRGAYKYPPVPLPVTSEFDLKVPGHSTATDLEQSYLTRRVLVALDRDRDRDHPDLPASVLECDKLVLHMLQGTAKDARYNKSLGLVRMLETSQALEAARKIALRFDMTLLADKINQLIADNLD